MEQENALAQDIQRSKDAQYDAVCKRLLAYKEFLARIMQRCVVEFKDCTIDDIVNKYTEILYVTKRYSKQAFSVKYPSCGETAMGAPASERQPWQSNRPWCQSIKPVPRCQCHKIYYAYK